MLEAGADDTALSLPTHEFLSAVRDATADDGGARAAEPAEAAAAEAEVAAVVEGLVRGVAVDEAAYAMATARRSARFELKLLVWCGRSARATAFLRPC